MNMPTTSTSTRPLVWTKRISQVPKEVFVSESLFEEELRTIFYGDCWHVVAHEGELPEVGDFKTFELGRMPLLIVRGKDRQVRVFLNSCTHRGTQVETASCGNRTEFECPYHRWLFGLEGDLVGCPGSKEFSPEFQKEDYDLKEVRVGVHLGLVFVTLGKATPPLEDWIGAPIMEPLSVVLGGDGRLKLLGYQKVRYAVNWKAYNDNDGYHAPLLHTGFRLLNWQGGQGAQYMTENGHACIVAQLKPIQHSGFLKDTSLITFKGQNPEKGSCVVQLFPCSVVVKHLDVINLRFAIARSHDVTEVHYAYFAHVDDSEDMVRHRLRQSSNLLGPCGMVTMEDAAIFQRIHIGSYTPGQAEFQKGVTGGDQPSFDVKQNDETGQLPKWEHYRKLMGFQREA
ncbi:Terephthalate 1,2-dioxygenase, terminal oxygenase component subunit alpha 1 [Xylophilus ampelinus]|uniref:aromatic ring-hydroxylating oxygenase subunit alpha n=1 Tax=Comamonadaceae TaxID=80864 RepID=UPI000B28A182|nr:aromatic ring-hydroxylating dioxygenase subunit alpha [Xenophilus azovorans]MBN8746472.1 aromatic ring-hydroxylating dioxygenase subunit alpha [Variovorax sp.]VTY38149.1 Terephthalate 1,2-dioxygenase, terminal oxygenase component subunit alpha 1 [Xylophilus ampelinus]